MRKIFKRFRRSSKIASPSSEIIHASLDVDSFDAQLTEYEGLMYAGFRGEDVLLSLKEQRYKWLLFQVNFPLSTLLSVSSYLSNMLTGLSEIVQTLEAQSTSFWSSFLSEDWRLESQHYRSASGKVKAFYYRLLEEFVLVTAVLSARLKYWYEIPTVTLQQSGSERFYHVGQEASEEESTFFHIVDRVTTFQRFVITLPLSESSYKATLSAQSLSVQDNLVDGITKKQHAIQDHLEPLGLSMTGLSALNKQHRSFWRTDRYRAKLTFIQLDYKRCQRLLPREAYPEHWALHQATLRKCEVARQQLNSFFYRKTRKLYKTFEKEVSGRLGDLAKKGLIHALDHEDFLTYCTEHESTLSSWCGQLSAQLKSYWRILLSGLSDPSGMNADQWQMAISQLAQWLNLSKAQQNNLIQRWLRTYVAPKIQGIDHPSYPLVYQHLPETAYRIMAPSVQDVLVHLKDELAWQSVERARTHLGFLLQGTPHIESLQADPAVAKAFLFKCNIHVESLLFRELFLELSGKAVWERFGSLQTAVELPVSLKTTIETVLAFYAQAPGEVSAETNLSMLFLGQMSLQSVQALQKDQRAWMQCLLSWRRVVEWIHPAVQDTQHAYHSASLNFLQQMAENLLIISHDFQVIKTPLLKQLLQYCQAQTSLTLDLRNALEQRLETWDICDIPPPRSDMPTPKKTSRMLTPIQTFLKKMYGVMATLHDLAHRTVLGGLTLDFKLTRAELEQLAAPEVLEEPTGLADRMTLMTLLEGLLDNVFVSAAAQRQAKLLIQIVSPGVPETKAKAVSDYLDTVSRAAQRERNTPSPAASVKEDQNAAFTFH